MLLSDQVDFTNKDMVTKLIEKLMSTSIDMDDSLTKSIFQLSEAALTQLIFELLNDNVDFELSDNPHGIKFELKDFN